MFFLFKNCRYYRITGIITVIYFAYYVEKMFIGLASDISDWAYTLKAWVQSPGLPPAGGGS